MAELRSEPIGRDFCHLQAASPDQYVMRPLVPDLSQTRGRAGPREAPSFSTSGPQSQPSSGRDPWQTEMAGAHASKRTTDWVRSHGATDGRSHVSFSHATRPGGICPEVRSPLKSESPKVSFTQWPDKAKPPRKQTQGTADARACPPPRTRGRSDGPEESLEAGLLLQGDPWGFHRCETGAAPPT